MASRKRGRAEMEAEEPPRARSLLTRLRNMWEFANLMQFIMLFGHVFKIDENFEIEDLENESMKPEPSHKLLEIGLCMLKFISSTRGLTPEMFDEHTSRQYKRRAPENNPFGDEEEPKKFLDFDIFTKLRVLSQLSRWVFLFPDRLREKMPQSKDSDQTEWRVQEIGWDRDERIYYILDDNRLYRRTEPKISGPAPKPKPKAKAKAKQKPKKPEPRKGIRSSKRRRIIEDDEEDVQIEDEEEAEIENDNPEPKEEGDTDDGFGWECVAVTLEEYHEFLNSIKKSKDANEKALYRHIFNETLPVLDKLEEERQKKVARRQKEIINMEKMAHAKRSSRIANRHEKEQQEAEARAAEQKRAIDLQAARKDAERQKQMEEARESRMLTREQRLKEREYKRILHEEELKNLEENSKKLEDGESRISERHLKAEMARRQKELEELEEEEDWVFDCAKCGVHGENVDDGSHSVACERCNVWQHSACLGISQQDAEKEDFHFICQGCKRREEDAKKPKIPALKFKINSSPPQNVEVRVPIKLQSNSPEVPSKKRKSSELENAIPGMPPMKKWRPPAVQKLANGPALNGSNSSSSMHQSIMKGPKLTPHGQQGLYQGVNGHQPGAAAGLTSPTRPAIQVNGAKANGPPVGIFSNAMQSLHGHAPVHNHPGQPALFGQPTNGLMAASPSNSRPQSANSQGQTPGPPASRSNFTTPNNSFVGKSRPHSPAYPNSPATNLPPSSAATPVLLPGFSPQKPVQSSPAPPTPHSPSLHAQSSPTIIPPSTNLQEAGLSPVKHEPPRPASGHDDVQPLSKKTTTNNSLTELLPPEPQLSQPSSPQKQVTTE